jgi:hypothetical protein
VDVSRNDLVLRFRNLSDDELMSRLRAGTLTPLAIEVATVELQARGIEPPGADASDHAFVEAGLTDLSNKDLLRRLHAGTLSPAAVEIVNAELRARGVEPPSAGNDAPGDDAQNVAPAGDLVDIAEFWNPMEANLLRSLLEADGIFVHMWGEHLGTLNPFLSVVSPALKVQVRSSQAAQARELVAAFKRGDLAMKDEPE